MDIPRTSTFIYSHTHVDRQMGSGRTVYFRGERGVVMAAMMTSANKSMAAVERLLTGSHSQRRSQ